MMSTQLLKFVNFDATIAVVISAFHASHRGFWGLSWFLCVSIISDITHIADGGTPYFHRSLEFQEVLHEEVLLYTIHSVYWYNKLFSTQRTRHLVSWIHLRRFSNHIQTLKA